MTFVEGTLPYLFAAIFLLLSIVYHIMYAPRALGFTLSRVLKWLVLPKDVVLDIGKLAFAPLSGRILFSDIYYFSGNASLHLTDGYVMFNFWSQSLAGRVEKGWKRVKKVSKSYEGAVCRVRGGSFGTQWLNGKIKVLGAEVNVYRVVMNFDHSQEFKIDPSSKDIEFDVHDYRGRLQVKLNGMEVGLHNSTAKYENLPKDGKPPAEKVEVGEEGKKSQSDGAATTKYTPGVFETFMEFVGKIDIQIFNASVNLGGLQQKHPYFLHLGFENAVGSYFLSEAGVLSADVYRQVVDVALANVVCKWMHRDSKKPIKKPKKEEAGGWWKRVRRGLAANTALMLQGDAGMNEEGDQNAEEEVLSSKYGVIIPPKSDSNLRIVYYWDVPGLQPRDEPPATAESLPKLGVEVEIDAKEIYYGSWADLCRKELTRHFFPLDYLPWNLFKSEPGKERPCGMYEQLVSFSRDCTLFYTFKQKTVVPSPPHGVEDSGRNGYMNIEMGAGSTYLYKYPWVMPEDEGCIVTETLFNATNVGIKTSLNDSYFIKAANFELVLDAEFPQYWNDKQTWDFLMTFTEAEVWYLSDHQGWLWDVLADYSYAPEMYHGADIFRYLTKQYVTEEAIPYTQLYEVFFVTRNPDVPALKVYFNVNPNNVIYSSDHTSVEENTFLVLQCQSGEVHYSAPLDQYCLAEENEYKYDYDITLEQVGLVLTLPQSHEAASFHNNDNVFLRIGTMSIDGYFSAVSPNLSEHVPVMQQPTNADEGPSQLQNSSLMNICMDSVTGDVMGQHVTALANWFGNNFSEEASFVTPEEFFWLANHFAGASSGKNLKYPYTAFQTRHQPKRNDLEFFMDLTVKDVSVSVLGAREMALPSLPVQFAELTMTTQSAASHYSMTLDSTPVIVRLPAVDGGRTKDCYICLAGGHLSKITHYGPAPAYNVFAGSTKGGVELVSLHVTPGHVALLSNVSDRFSALMAAEDKVLRRHIETAKENAHNYTGAPGNYTAVSTATRHRRRASLATIDVGRPVGTTDKVRKGLLAEDTSVIPPFVAYLDEKQRNLELALDFGVFVTDYSIGRVNVAVKVGSTGYGSVVCPKGLRYAASTANDTNTNKRWSVVVPHIHIRLLTQKTPDMLAAEVEGDYLEVGNLRTSFCLRQSTTLPGENGVVQHYQHQKAYFTKNNYTDFVTIDLDQGREPLIDMSRRQSRGVRQNQPMVRSIPFPSAKIEPAIVHVETEGTASSEASAASLEDLQTKTEKSSKNFGTCYSSLSSDIEAELREFEEGEESGFDDNENDLDEDNDEPRDENQEVAPRPQMAFHECLRPCEFYHDTTCLSLYSYAPGQTLPNGPEKNLVGSRSHAPQVLFIGLGNFQHDHDDTSTVDIGWAFRGVDNAKRSREGATTIHTHVEIPTVCHALVTVKSIRLLLSVESSLTISQKNFKMCAPSPSIKERSKKPRPSSPRSRKARVRQWSSTDTIYSIIAPRVRARAISELQAPSYQHPLWKERNPTGVYHACVWMDSLQVVYHSSAPALKSRSTITRTAASISAKSLALTTHVLCENFSRTGTLSYSSSSGIDLDLPQFKDAYLTGALIVEHITCKVQSDEQSAERKRMLGSGGVTRMNLHLTRDFPHVVAHTINEFESALYLSRGTSHGASPSGSPSTTPRAARVMPSINVVESDGSESDTNQTESHASAALNRIHGYDIQFVGNVGDLYAEYVNVTVPLTVARANIDSGRSSTMHISGITVRTSSRTPEDDSNRVVLVVSDVQSSAIDLYPTITTLTATIFELIGYREQHSPSRMTPERQSTASAGPKTEVVVQSSFRNLTLSLLYSRSNYASFHMGRLTVSFGSQQNVKARPDNISPSVEATPKLSEGVKTTIFSKLNAMKSKRTQRPKAIPQFDVSNAELDASVVFKVDSCTVQYVADLSVLKNVAAASYEQLHLNSKTAVIVSVTSRSMTMSWQHIAGLTKDNHSVETVNIFLDNCMLEAPFRPNMVDIVHPQYREFSRVWREALDMEAAGTGPANSPDVTPGSPSIRVNSNGEGSLGSQSLGHSMSQANIEPPQRKNWAIALDVSRVEVKAGLQRSTVSFVVPRILSWIDHSDTLSGTRTHIYPPYLVSKSHNIERTMTLPQVFIFTTTNTALQKTKVEVMIDKLDTAVTTDLFNHTLLLYEKLTEELVGMLSDSGESTEETAMPPQSTTRVTDVSIVMAGINICVLSGRCELGIDVGTISAAIRSTMNDTGVVTNHWKAGIAWADAGLYDREDFGLRNPGFTEKSTSSNGALGRKESMIRTRQTSQTANDDETTRQRLIRGGFVWMLMHCNFSVTNVPEKKAVVVADESASTPVHEKSIFDDNSFEEDFTTADDLAQAAAETDINSRERIVPVCFTTTETLVYVRGGAIENLTLLLSEYTTAWSEVKHDVENRKLEIKSKLQQSARFNRMALRAQQLEYTMMSGSTLSDDESKRQSVRAFFDAKEVLVVVPIGEAAYKTLSSIPLSWYACGKTQVKDHRHTQFCLDRRRFMAASAVKLSIGSVTMCWGKDVDKDAPHVFQEGANVPTRTSLSVKTHAIDIYTTEGTKIDPKGGLPTLLDTRKIVGGTGLLTSPSASELPRAKNRISLAKTEWSVQYDTSAESRFTVKVLGDVSGPQIHLNPRAVCVIEDVLDDFQCLPLEETNKPMSAIAKPKKDKKEPLVLTTVDVAVAVVPGVLSFNSLQSLPVGLSLGTTTPSASSGRRVSFTRGKSDKKEGPTNTAVFSMPTPELNLSCVYSSASTSYFRLCVAQQPIEMGSTVALLTKEYIHVRPIVVQERQERATALLQQLRVMEEVATANKTLHSIHVPYLDAICPVPRILAGHFMDGTVRMRHPSSTDAAGKKVHFHPDQVVKKQQKMQHNTSMQQRPVAPDSSDLPSDAHHSSPVTIQSGWVFHLNVLPFRASLTAHPVSQTALSLYMEDSGGVNVVWAVGEQRGMQSVFVDVKGLHVDLQTKLEMKCLEFILPHAVFSHATNGTRSSISINLPVTSVKSNAIECTFRLPQISQAFLLYHLWQRKAKEAQHALNTIEKAELVRRQSTTTPIGGSPPAPPPAVDYSLSLLIPSAVLRTDCGICKQELTVQHVGLLGSNQGGSVTNRVSVLDFGAHDVVVKLDGQISGVASLDQGIYARVVYLGPNAVSPEGRLINAGLSVPAVKINLRERQLKDILMLEVGSLVVRVADRVGDGPYNVNLAVEVARLVAGVTADAPISVHSTVESVETLVAEQRTVAHTKLESNKMYTASTLLDEVTKDTPSLSDASGNSFDIFIPYVGMPKMLLVPVGQVAIHLADVQLHIGSVQQSVDAQGIVFTTNKLAITFAECLDSNDVMKRAVQLRLVSWELLRKAQRRVVLLGGQQENLFELFTVQKIHSPEVGYHFNFKHAQPWYGSPHPNDFDALNTTIKNFADAVSQSGSRSSNEEPSEPTPDLRTYNALKPSRFAPELRVVSDMNLSIDIILGWVGIEEQAVPMLFHTMVGDPIEGLLYSTYMATASDEVVEEGKTAVLMVPRMESLSDFGTGTV